MKTIFQYPAVCRYRQKGSLLYFQKRNKKKKKHCVEWVVECFDLRFYALQQSVDANKLSNFNEWQCTQYDAIL